MKNPSIERRKHNLAPGPYDPQVGLYITPPIVTKTAEVPSTKTKVRRRIPRPPSKLQLRCAYAWSCIACLIGNFLCAIPALRYTVTASESAKVHDYNSARSYLRKAYILCALGLAIAAGGWTVLILYLSGSIQT
ncbi:hypothetical protein BaRGS_00016557 [Batillaria attramentaria]|uniref:Uncharacterized protein n=1 Tax=Batillaria attramentaria TaxID=370345 RepID=A0ABD0KYN6_9CAEN